jgi:hypothetical protein
MRVLTGDLAIRNLPNGIQAYVAYQDDCSYDHVNLSTAKGFVAPVFICIITHYQEAATLRNRVRKIFEDLMLAVAANDDVAGVDMA